MSQLVRSFILTMILTVIAVLIALPAHIPYNFNIFNKQYTGEIGTPGFQFELFGGQYGFTPKDYRQGLDIQGGVQVVLEADMSEIEVVDRTNALDSAKEIINRRVDQFGIAEPVVRTAINGESYRIIVELPGAQNVNEALALVGRTAQLDFRLIRQTNATTSAEFINSIEDTGLSGSQLERATVQFDQTTGEPVVAIEFNEQGIELFADITTENTGQLLAIVIDDGILMAPEISVPIINGIAEIRGGFTPDQAKQLAIQLNAGALPVPITILEQRTVGAALGAESVTKSLQAGIIGLILLIVFLIAYYGMPAVLATVALFIYIALVMAIYKIIGVTLTLPAITGMFLSTSMAVDAMILIFERYKEEVRSGRSFEQALNQSFGRAWNSIKDANTATTITALVLINPFDFAFLNSGGVVRGFGITVLIGIIVGLFTGVIVIRTLMRLFLAPTEVPAREKLFGSSTTKQVQE